MTKRQARVIALRLAYEAVQKACDCGGEEAGAGTEAYDDQIKIDRALGDLAQRLYERWAAAAQRMGT